MQVTPASHAVGFRAASVSYGIALPQITSASKSGIYSEKLPQNINLYPKAIEVVIHS
jgi:hypothetical protein